MALKHLIFGQFIKVLENKKVLMLCEIDKLMLKVLKFLNKKQC